jgi:hypothetical protein
MIDFNGKKCSAKRWAQLALTQRVKDWEWETDSEAVLPIGGMSGLPKDCMTESQIKDVRDQMQKAIDRICKLLHAEE